MAMFLSSKSGSIESNQSFVPDAISDLSDMDGHPFLDAAVSIVYHRDEGSTARSQEAALPERAAYLQLIRPTTLPLEGIAGEKRTKTSLASRAAFDLQATFSLRALPWA
jgi:hypothetical protein